MVGSHGYAKEMIMWQWIQQKRGSASRGTKLAVGFTVGAVCGGLLFGVGVPQFAITGITVGVAAGVAYAI